jgi:hypothetical protein
MKVLLDGIEIDKEAIAVNDGLNYGRFFDHQTKEYELHLSHSELIDFIQKEYNEVRDEMQIDDRVNNDESDFSVTGY